MALPLNNTFEGGSDTTAITAGNSGGGSGNPFDDVLVGGSNAITYSNEQAAHGGLSAKFTIASADGAQVRWLAPSIGTQTEIWGRFYIWKAAVPGAQQRFLRCQNAAQVDTCYAVWHTDGLLYIFDASGGFSSISTPIPTSAWARVEYHLIAHASTGTWEAKLFSGDSTTELGSASRTSVNTGSDVARNAFGNTTSASVGNFYMDDLNVNGTGFPGPVSAPPKKIQVVRSNLRW